MTNLLTELLIPPGQGGRFFLNKDLRWTNIPQLSVISGVNGSGKTQLLREIKMVLSKDVNKKNRFFFREHDHTRNIFQKEYDKGEKEKKDKDLISKLIRFKADFAKDQKIRERLKTNDPKTHFVIESIEKEPIDLKTLSNEQIEDFVLRFPAELLEENIDNIKSEAVFIRFLETKESLEARTIDFDEGPEERRSFVNKELAKIYGSSTPPWEVINEKLSKFYFRHRIKTPSKVGNHQLKFVSDDESDISYIDLSSGEKIIVELILWSYSVNENIKNDSFGKLLIMDEFDAHLNPSMAQMFIEVIKDILVKQFGMQVIITTHSPSTIAYCDEESLFWIEHGEIKKKEKQEIVELLTPGILTLRSDKLLFLTDQSKEFIIFTEGDTDILYIKAAAKKLNYKEILDKCQFLPANGDKGKDYFNIFKPKNQKSEKKIIVIFDYDKKGISAFNSLNKNNQIKISSNDSDDNSPKVYSEGGCYAMLIPRNREEYENESKYGCHPIEFLFKKKDLLKFEKDYTLTKTIKEEIGQSLNDKCYFKPTRSTPIQILNLNKENLAEYVSKEESEINFDNFKTLLEEISKVMNYSEQ